MSAESPRKSNRQGGYVVAPQPVTDRSIIESVAGFINEVVPQGYSGPVCDGKEVITWARFEQADINDPGLYPDSVDEPTRAPPLLLVLGYANGVQVWAVPASGEATEVLSWRQGVVRTLRILPTPPTGDSFAHKRPLVALCDTASPGPQFCSLSFISLRAGDQVKSIKFKNPVTAVLANVRCVVVTFFERIAVFDACTLEDRLTVTTCYPSPGININPVALGSRWLAYAERRLLPAKRCSGGTEGEGIQSYTATVLHAAKSLSKGLRELGETVASSLTGGVTPPGVRPPGGLPDTDFLNPGIVTILDIKGTSKENGRTEESVVAHFTAHGDAIVAMQFDPSGMLLATADKRGHDFHVFRIQPHPGGSSLAAVHHLYVLHRGDTTAKVQDLVFAWDSRWLAVSTLRGTTHVFPVTPYGGAVGLRTHSTPHVVNRLSRFHRSAGLTADGRNSPQPCEGGGCGPHHPAMAHANPRLPPYPHPTVVTPLAQVRQSQPTPAPPPGRSPGTRRSHAPDENGTTPLRVSACFGAPRAWLVGSPTAPRDSSSRARRRAVDSLFVMACHGNLIQYDLETKHASGTPREKVCDDTPIELEVQAKAQWMLGGLLRTGGEVQPPLPPTSLLIAPPSQAPPLATDQSDERWLSQVEIVTHAGPHRRLWMGPQFTFKTYAQPSAGVPLVEPDGPGSRLVRSNPVNMPLPPVVPVLIESGSGSSYEQSPRLLEAYGHSTDGSEGSGGPGDVRLREDLADAMLESPGVANRHTGRRVIVEICSGKRSQANPIEKIVNPVGSVLTVLTDDGLGDGFTGEAETEEATVRWPTDVIRTAAEATPTLQDMPLSDTHAESQNSSQRSESKSNQSGRVSNKLQNVRKGRSTAKEILEPHDSTPIITGHHKEDSNNVVSAPILVEQEDSCSPVDTGIVTKTEVDTKSHIRNDQKKVRKDFSVTDVTRFSNQPVSFTKKEAEKQGESFPERTEKNRAKRKTSAKEKGENCVEICDNVQNILRSKSPPKASVREGTKKVLGDSNVASSKASDDSKENVSEPAEKITSNLAIDNAGFSSAFSEVISVPNNLETNDCLQQLVAKNSSDLSPITQKITKKQLHTASKSKRNTNVLTEKEQLATPLKATFQRAESELDAEIESSFLSSLTTNLLETIASDNLMEETKECAAIVEEIKDAITSIDLPGNSDRETDLTEKKKQGFPELKSDIKVKVYSKDKSYNRDKKSSSPPKSYSYSASKDNTEPPVFEEKKSWSKKTDLQTNIDTSKVIDVVQTADTDLDHESCARQSKREPTAIGKPEIVDLKQAKEKTDSSMISRARKYQGLDLDDVEITSTAQHHPVPEQISKSSSKRKSKISEMPDGSRDKCDPSRKSNINKITDSDSFNQNTDKIRPMDVLECSNLKPCSLGPRESLHPSSLATSMSPSESTTDISESIARENTSNIKKHETKEEALKSVRNESTVTTWSSIASGKRRPELTTPKASPPPEEKSPSVPSEEPEFLPLKSWSTIVKTTSASCVPSDIASNSSCTAEPSEIVEDKRLETEPCEIVGDDRLDAGATVEASETPSRDSPGHRSLEVNVPLEEDDETPTSVQASKKNRKIKKKRR